MEIKELLEKVKTGEMELSRAEEILKELPYENLGYANLDHHRQLRNGYGETVYCESKTAEQIEGILHSFQKMGSNVMGTRVKPEQYTYLKERFPELIYHPEARIIMLMDHPVEQVGMVAVCTAGTSDIPVAEEAALTAEFFGSRVDRIFDVGVAGIHRLLARTEEIRKANCVVGCGRNGGRSRKRDGWARGKSGYCSTDFRWLRRILRRCFRPSDHAQFLRGGYGYGEYR